jgi:hypothetical protein
MPMWLKAKVQAVLREELMLIDAEKYLAFLDELVKKAQVNVWEYEEFHEDRLADIPSMNPMDSFLYGVASGKLQQLEYLRDMVEARKEELGE